MTPQVTPHDHPFKNGVDHLGDHGVIIFSSPIDAAGGRVF